MSATRTLARRGHVLIQQEPLIMVHESTVLPCGCVVHIGFRLDNGEGASAAIECEAAHWQLMEHFNLLLKESLVAPTRRPLIDVVEDLLGEAERHWEGRAS